jgi:bifunctional DNA-binding transcriptional regulator/antitoxin component of YhaV-PrlF toxin-antitoxin module
MSAYLSTMNAVLTDDGKIVLPPKLRADARLQPGDTLDVQLYKGSIVLRKHQPLTPEQCAALLERSRSQPKPSADDESAVEEALREVRAQRQ